MIIETPPRSVQIHFLKNAISQWDWAIFPLNKVHRNYNGTRTWCGCRDRMLCTALGKCPRVRWGFRENHLRPEDVEEWIANGYTNFGIHLGWSGLIALDMDTRNHGQATWDELTGHAPPPTTNYVDTSRGGFHFYFRNNGAADPVYGMFSPAGRRLTNIEIGNGLELLSGQHFTVAPYSVHWTGKVYSPVFDRGFALFEEPTNVGILSETL